MNVTDLKRQLESVHQSHLLRFWDTLSIEQQQRLAGQIEQCDFPQLATVWTSSTRSPDASPHKSTRPDIARAPHDVVRQPKTSADHASWSHATTVGAAAIRAGRVAVITVAGGQGTRLGFDKPKGLFPIGPATDRSLFQNFAEQILARSRRYSSSIAWLIMTSAATHSETVAFFESKRYFGLEPTSVTFFQQGSLPALDARTGHVLMSSRDELALSPDGHGGLIAALKSAGLLDQLARDGVQHLYYHQVDNPTAIVPDPALIGWHVLRQSQMTTNVVQKVSPTERMGVLVDLNGRTEIIEYSELNPEQAARRNETGQWIFWAGNTATHVLDVAFLAAIADSASGLPLHVAHKNVPFLDDNGHLVRSHDAQHPNAIKLERFIFDALPMADRTLIVEGDRAREFNPVKNADGADSPTTARAALDRIAREWASAAGLELPDGQPIELSPLMALDAAELAEKVQRGEVTVASFS